MILTCPACKTSYSVKDGAIPPQGRTVRCAACKHSWHQDGEAAEIAEADTPVLDGASEAQPEALSDGNAAGIAVGEPEFQSGEIEGSGVKPVAEQIEPEVVEAPAEAEAYPAWNDAGYGGDEEPPRRRRGLMTILLLILVIAVIAIAAWFLAPHEWMARAGLVAPSSSDSPLKLMVTSQDRQKLASGNDLVSLSGRVVNPTDATQPVPGLQADLRNNGGKLVYSWTIAPPAERLGPRASASFNAAELGVPADATSLTLRWAR